MAKLLRTLPQEAALLNKHLVKGIATALLSQFGSKYISCGFFFITLPSRPLGGILSEVIP